MPRAWSKPVEKEIKSSRIDLFTRRYFGARRCAFLRKRRIGMRLRKDVPRVKESKDVQVDHYDHGIMQGPSVLPSRQTRKPSYVRRQEPNFGTAYTKGSPLYSMATMPLTSSEADALASRARSEVRKLVGTDGKLIMQEVKSMLRCTSLQLARSIMAHLPYQVLVDLKNSDYGRHIGLDNQTYPLITGDIINSALLAADQRERVFWLKRDVPTETDIACASCEDNPIPPPPLNPNASRAVCVFGNDGSLANRHWFKRRNLEFEEASHPSVHPRKDVLAKSRMSELAVVNSFEHFDMNLWAFSHGILEGVLGNGAVIGGSAVMAAMMAQEQDVQRMLERRAALEKLFRRTLRNEACTRKIFEYTGEKLDSLQDMFDSRSSPFRSADLDIYIVADTKAAAASRLVLALNRIVSNMEAYGHVAVVETPNAFTICGAWPLRHVQLVTHVRESIDEIFCFVDMDCTALAFDGRDVWVAPRAVRAFATGYNFVAPRSMTKRSSTVQRAAKYGRRGFGLLTFELCKHMPRCDVKVEKEVSEALSRTDSLFDHKAAPPGPQEISAALNRCQAPGADAAAIGATVAKVMRRMQQAGGSILPRGPGIGGNAVQAYIDMLPFLMEAGLVRSPPLTASPREISPSEVLKKIVWHRRTNAPWADWGMVPSAPWKRSPGSACYQCRGPISLQTFPEKENMSSSDKTASTRVKVCAACASLNASKRCQVMDMVGKTALVTGGRAKIGYEVAVKLLQSGALVLLTTRFPYQAALRFANDIRTASSLDKLHIYGIDFRHLRSMTDFCDHILEHYHAIDVMVHNAAQTVRRPPAYYRELFEEERSLVDSLPDKFFYIVKHVGFNPHKVEESVDRRRNIMSKETSIAHRQRNEAKRTMAMELSSFGNESCAPSHVAELLRRAQAAVAEAKGSVGAVDPMASLFSSALAVIPLLPSDKEAELRKEELFPTSLRDIHGEPLDLRTSTSWTAPLDQVPLLELMEVLVVNSVAPFLLTSRLLPRLRTAAAAAHGCGGAFVVNVSSSEGVFDPSKAKGSEHPHTNMGKAALNMLTRTIAEDLASQGVFVTSADTGWISQMRPNPKVWPPLTEEDGAARVLDPVMAGIAALRKGETPVHGVMFQHFNIVDW